MAHAELEIVLRWRRLEDAFDVSLAYDDPNGPQDRRDYVDEPLTVDTAKLMDLVAEDEEYGKTIGGMLLNVPKISTFYNKALTAASVRTFRCMCGFSLIPERHCATTLSDGRRYGIPTMDSASLPATIYCCPAISAHQTLPSAPS